jgi:hypothetical protein
VYWNTGCSVILCTLFKVQIKLLSGRGQCPAYQYKARLGPGEDISFCLWGGGGLVMIGEAKLKMSSDKLHAPCSVQVACFRRGDAYGWRAVPWLLPQGSSGGLGAHRGPSPLWLLLPPKSPKIFTLIHRFQRWRRLRWRRPPTGPQTAISNPGKGARAPPPCTIVPRPKKCSFALSVRIFATLKCGPGRRFPSTWIRCTFLSGAFKKLGNWLPL